MPPKMGSLASCACCIFSIDTAWHREGTGRGPAEPVSQEDRPPRTLNCLLTHTSWPADHQQGLGQPTHHSALLPLVFPPRSCAWPTLSTLSVLQSPPWATWVLTRPASKGRCQPSAGSWVPRLDTLARHRTGLARLTCRGAPSIPGENHSPGVFQHTNGWVYLPLPDANSCTRESRCRASGSSCSFPGLCSGGRPPGIGPVTAFSPQVKLVFSVRHPILKQHFLSERQIYR